ncbi:hypothetical protein, partial [Nocardia brasiliensis]|uniref:hypothetical protein n=1 Tax=Nocardia brasiliensis TaxID=37326 RepID=UPI0024583C59
TAVQIQLHGVLELTGAPARRGPPGGGGAPRRRSRPQGKVEMTPPDIRSVQWAGAGSVPSVLVIAHHFRSALRSPAWAGGVAWD